MTPTDDQELDLLLREASGQPPGADSACIDRPEFDLGRVLALGSGAEDPAAEDHVARCAFCRAMLVEVGQPVNDLLVARMNRQWPRESGSKKWAFAGVGTVIALAATLAVTLMRPTDLPAPPELSLEGPFGGLTEVRSDVPESNVFVPDSQVRIVLRPAGGPVAPGAIVAVYRVEGEGRLLRLPASIAQPQPNGAWLLQGEGRAIFGDQAGPKRLLVVVAGAPQALEGLDGGSPEAARGRPGLKVHELRVEYRLTP